jgi:hypothetical protein
MNYHPYFTQFIPVLKDFIKRNKKFDNFADEVVISYKNRIV